MNSLKVRYILRHGHALKSPVASLHYFPRQAAVGEVACIVGRKVHSQAVSRHRYQRLLREAARRFLKANPDYDMVVVAKPEILRVKNLTELQKILQPHLDKLVPNSKFKT
ncbi:MAG: ribonuclease P protein component [Patescibacteria group bacterium]